MTTYKAWNKKSMIWAHPNSIISKCVLCVKTGVCVLKSRRGVPKVPKPVDFRGGPGARRARIKNKSVAPRENFLFVPQNAKKQ